MLEPTLKVGAPEAPRATGTASFVQGQRPLQLQRPIRAAFAAWRQKWLTRLIRRED